MPGTSEHPDLSELVAGLHATCKELYEACGPAADWKGACGTPGCIPCTAADLIESQAADLSRLREERDQLTHDRDEGRDEADRWRQQAWFEGYPRDSGDRHPWETSDDYRALLAAGWASPTPRLPPSVRSPDPTVVQP